MPDLRQQPYREPLPANRYSSDLRNALPPAPEPREQLDSAYRYGVRVPRIGLGGTMPWQTAFAPGKQYGSDGGLVAAKPMNPNNPIQKEVQRFNAGSPAAPDPGMLARQRDMEQRMNGYGSRPGRGPEMNAVQQARMQMGMGIGGSMVPPGGGYGPRQAALAHYSPPGQSGA